MLEFRHFFLYLCRVVRVLKLISYKINLWGLELISEISYKFAPYYCNASIIDQ